MKLSGSNQSVEKTIRIIEVLAASPTPMRLSEIAKGVDVPASTVLRMLNTLVEMGYAYQEEEGLRRYGLTMHFLYIGKMVADHFSIRDIAHPFLKELSLDTGESCCLAIEDRNVVRYVDVVENSHALITIRQRIGGEALMHCTGSGKVLLMQKSEEEIDRYIALKGLPQLTVHSLGTREKLISELEDCRRNGYAMDDEECEIGMRCLAVPVYDERGKVIAAICLSGPVTRMPMERCITELIPKICQKAELISRTVSGCAKR